MYADDTVILANSKTNLQKGLDVLNDYCKKWKLKVNSDKTKIVIFSKRKVNNNKFNFIFNDSEIEIVEYFKYLGVTFKYNNNFDLCRKNLTNLASRAMFSLLSKSKKLHLPIDLQLELFDQLVLPILCYGSELWGYENCNILENLHMRYR